MATLNYTADDGVRMSIIDNLIYDRTQADVDRAKTLNAMRFADMTAEQQMEYLAGLKGAYNASDINRVCEAVEYISDKLASVGISAPFTPVRTMDESVIPTTAEMDTYLRNVRAMRSAIAVWSTTPHVADSIEGFTYSEANDLEKILADIDDVIQHIVYYFSGEIYCGEV